MARVSTVLAAALAALVLLAAGASAAPCIPCSMCMTKNCESYCSESCPESADAQQPKADPAPSEVTVSVTTCIKRGASYGPSAADKACRLAIVYCNGGRPLGAANDADAADATNVAQCSNAAMGACQRVAAAKAPCASMLQNGFRDCTAEQMNAFWRGEVESHCRDWAAQMTDVDPGTDAWRGQQQQPQQQQDGGWTNGSRRLLMAARSRLHTVRLPKQQQRIVVA